MKQFFIAGLILLSNSFYTYASSPSVYKESQRILHGLRRTAYSHHPYVNESRGIYELDCSAFAEYVLGNASPTSGEELKSLVSPKRPLAKDFVNFFDRLKKDDGTHWQRIRYLRHLKRGDLIAWLIPSTSTSTDTGHVMIVSGEVKPNPHYKNEWLVPVTDAAQSGHGRNDPRRHNGPNGVGTGLIGLIADEKDRPIAFRWAGGESPEIKYTTIRMARTLD